MTKNMKDLILGLQNKEMNEQKIILEKSFQSWKMSREQIDDVLVIGVRI